jgi:hypothetical protein
MARAFNDAASQYLEINSSVISAAYPVSMACWLNSDADNLAQTLIFVGDKDVANHFHRLFIHGAVAGDPLRIASVGGGPTAVASTTTGYSANTWHHAAAVFTASDDRAVWIDGGSKGTNAQNVTPANMDRTSVARAGDSTPSEYMSGYIAEAAVWDAALSDDEVAVLADGYSPLFVKPENLVAYWPLIRDTDDDVVGGYDLTPANAPTVVAHPPQMKYPAPPLLFAGPYRTPRYPTVLYQIPAVY